MFQGHRISVIVPALNEAQAVAQVIRGLRALTQDGEPLLDQIIVCDNGSTDATAVRARAAGAEVVREPARGYGAACLRAQRALEPCAAILYVDADGSVDPDDIPPLLRAWQGGSALVVGSRKLGMVAPGAMSRSQRLGNALACALIRGIWRRPVTDLGPLRLIDREALEALAMADQAYGWTAEMQCKALNAGLRVTEVPVSVARRAGPSKISGSWLGVFRAGRGILGMVARCALARANTKGQRAAGTLDEVRKQGTSAP